MNKRMNNKQQTSFLDMQNMRNKRQEQDVSSALAGTVSKTKNAVLIAAIPVFLAFVSGCGGGGTALADSSASSNSSTNKDAESSDNHDSGASPFKIKEAKWDDEKSRLKVKGYGTKKLTVTIKNAASLLVLGQKRSEKSDWKFEFSNLDVVPCRVRAEQSNGSIAEKNVENAPDDCDNGQVDPPPPPPPIDPPPPPIDPPPPTSSNGAVRVLAANDLGMHCADKDFQVFSILPPFNVVHAQAVQKGTGASHPKILSNLTVDMNYRAASSPNDPAGANSINTTSQNANGVFKSNFWEHKPAGSNNTLAGLTYSLFYPAGVNFDPLQPDVGLPVPDVAALPQLIAEQQKMPGILNPYAANDPQPFLRFDQDVHFFGQIIANANWFAADGIPLAPVDDQGRSNPYPLMKVSATDRNTGQTLDSVDVVLPVASEADCQNCHADPDDQGNGAATTFASVNFDVVLAPNAPGPEKIGNAAKMNILRLHDAKHGADYTSSIDGSSTPCDSANNPADPDCLANQTPVQCSQCHYTPALDLAQVGPIDEPARGAKGRQQTRHVSMSRAMHANHARFKDPFGNPAFPSMPPPDDSRRIGGAPINAFERGILEQTCYQCHPGNKTQCLRGAMFSGGVVCQDCHGGLEQVGNDYSDTSPGSLAGVNKRIPWATEPKCQSCHTGDALNSNHPAGGIVSPDGIRLIQAYRKGDATAKPIVAPNSRFAENQSLYRLSGSDDGSGKGHNGVMCEGCHGSTHAIWPNANPLANDNVTARQVQGHTGAIVECDSCHAPGTLGNTLDGPHGMHPVGGTRFANGGHEKLAERNKNACRACHGSNGMGTVLSKVAADRSFTIEECENGTLCSGGKSKNVTINLQKGQQVSCVMCHENKL